MCYHKSGAQYHNVEFWLLIENRLPGLMGQKKISIRELSRRTGISYTILRDIYHMQRRSVQFDVLNAICRTLEVQPGDIFVYRPDA